MLKYYPQIIYFQLNGKDISNKQKSPPNTKRKNIPIQETWFLKK